MRLIFAICFLQIEFFSCILENKNDENLLDQINRERHRLGLDNVQIDLTLQLAAEKRCANRDELMQTYEKIHDQTYRNDQWVKEHSLDRLFPFVSEIIEFNHFENLLRIPQFSRNDLIYIGISEYSPMNISVRCILYGSSTNLISNHRRLLRLLVILIACGILLLSLIICSIFNDRRRTRLKEEIIENSQINNMPIRKSIRDRRSIPLPRRTEFTTTATRLGSTIDGRSSAVHSFFQSPR